MASVDSMLSEYTAMLAAYLKLIQHSIQVEVVASAGLVEHLPCCFLEWSWMPVNSLAPPHRLHSLLNR